MSTNAPKQEPADGRDSWASRNAATIMGVIAVTLIVVATIYTSLRH